ncbi:NAD-dependent succinate-semialdehyde dehydrogenase [Pseudoalteromonas phenolica]|uniref:Succinate-semialdehyde dehydrogenase I, NADP-dependent n=1 Tax=Pseudoalteromonas phenolica TaxID=161398 RepID=A0A0S2K5H3_9GAMM|nr:NAD-dependent succinate-semialdehyde dehydrogenase [Pseudoalteromonas phenolica]ALO43384.1 Succinate-semialdehyde dehydrogenase I, NADP-dependent [Pseudoalteromonas phenolica]MBE0355457.1 succinate-semialdehyde dehydrogenase / glutarate-semialdehyde dehydrogenase [Pseudoalteromonas phenolica O-BC30]
MYWSKALNSSLINGKSYQGSDSFTVNNPANEQLIETLSSVDMAGCQQALDAAITCFEALKSTTAKQRSDVLLKWHSLILEHKQALAELVTLEQGKVLKESLAEVDYAAGFVKWFADEALRSYGEVIPANSPTQQLTVIKQGVGVVFGVTPWNFPLAMISRKVAPAYAAGCSFILKPSEYTPLSALALCQLALQAGMETGAFQTLVTEDAAQVGAFFCEHKQVRKITFTGSTRVGQILLSQSAQSIKRASLELGGNAPFMVFESADIKKAVQGLLVAKFRNAGQTCVAANRVLVQNTCLDEFLAELKLQTARLKVADGFTEGADLGPLINTEAKLKAQSLVEDAVAQGTKIAYQGDEKAGQFMAPIILTEVNQSMEISRSEIFAPVVAIQTFENEAQALTIANSVDEGLAAYFYSQDMAQVQRVANSLEYGMVGINEALISNPVAPFGGMKASGLGREGARQGLEEYQEVKYLCQSY